MTETPVQPSLSHRIRTRKQLRIGVIRVISYLLLISGALIVLVPFLWLLRSSFMTTGQIFIFPPQWIPRPLTWENYLGAFTSVPFFRYFLNTMTIEIGVLLGVLSSGSIAAYSFARLRWRGRNVVFGAILSTLMMPYVATLIPTFEFWVRVHAVNTYIPLIVPAWFGGGAFTIFLLRQFLMTIPRELDEAAFMDGATPLQVYWYVILPLSKTAMIVVGLFTFVGVWGDFLNPLVYLSNQSLYTLAVGLSEFVSSYSSQWGYMMAASTAVAVPLIVLFFFLQRHFIEGISITGIKG